MGWKEIKQALICSNQDMENDQITNGWNDKRENNPESLGKGHSSLLRKSAQDKPQEVRD